MHYKIGCCFLGFSVVMIIVAAYVQPKIQQGECPPLVQRAKLCPIARFFLG